MDPPAHDIQTPEKPPIWALESTNLANERLGATVIFSTDEWFARAECLLAPSPAAFDPDAFTPQGKMMDGWESRRRRLPGHDWCVIKLGLPGIIRGVEIDTAFFTGNQVPRISLEVAELPSSAADGTSWGLPGAATRVANQGGTQGTAATPTEIEEALEACEAWDWQPLIAHKDVPLRPGYKDRCVHFFPALDQSAPSSKRATHVRVNYFPDGGVARLRVWGDVARDFSTELANAGSMDLASVANGGRGLGCSNSHYGVPRNLLQTGRGVNMGDGWETGRHPDRPRVIEIDPKTGLSNSSASDWAVIQLGAVCGGVECVLVDTKHFKGNFPESVQVDACHAPSASTAAVLESAKGGQGHGQGHGLGGSKECAWFPLLPRTRLKPDSEHVFTMPDLPAAVASRAASLAATANAAASGGGGALLAASARGKGVTHVRLTMFPDGGVMRLRVVGKAVAPLTAEGGGGGRFASKL